MSVDPTMHARSPGRVRVASVVTPASLYAVPTGSDLLVTGEDLSGEVTGWLATMQPRVSVNYVVRDELIATCTLEAEAPELIIVALRQLDTAGLAWVRQIVASLRLPVLVIATAHSAQRSAMRRQVQELGALDCLLRDELSTPLLEAAVAHARNFANLNARLGELRERFALAIRGARDGMWEWDLVRQRVFYSQRWRELLGLGGEPVQPTIETWLSRVHPQDLARLKADIESSLDGISEVHENEHRIRDGEGNWRWVLSRAVVHRNHKGAVVRMAGSLTDITPYRKREEALRQQSRHDALTKLPDRHVLLQRIARAVELAQAHEDFAFVVLMIEVDRLAQVRSSFGVAAADEMFAIVARRLRACLRPDDHLFRFSPDKLAIVLEDVDDPSVGTQVADRIHRSVAAPIELPIQTIAGEARTETTYTTVSIGMTSSAYGYTRADEVIADVSSAVDTARDRGRNRHEIYDTSMRIEARTLLALEIGMREAIDAEQFELHYQPLVRLGDRQLFGFEALVRWAHPERGQIPPSEFIPIAEDTGLLIPLGRWAIREALRRLHGWQEEFDLQGGISVSVNLSATQIVDPLLLETLDSALAETSLPPGSLRLELTESVMLDQAEQVTALLQDIRKRGIEIWIDDFGVGYSSLGYLHRFPVDGLKIDRTFVAALDGSPAGATMVRTIVSLAQNFKLGVIAEGIETEAQARQLTQLGCERGQGFLFGKAIDHAAVARMLRQRQR